MFWRFFRKYFLTGILVLLPLIITGYILIFAFNFVDGILRNLIQYIIGRPLPGAGFLIIFCLIFLTGLFTTNVVGRKLFAFGEEVLQRIPLVKTIYSAIKQIVEAFSLQSKEVFKRVVLIEYPRRGIYTVGFITGKAAEEINSKSGQQLLNVFIPTAPNPTSGFLLMLPRDEIVFLEMSVEEGMKLIISGGVVTPSAPSDRRSSGRTLISNDISPYVRR